MILRTVCESAGTAFVGAATSLVVGGNPAVGAAMAFVASLVTRVAQPVLEELPDLDDDELGRGCATLLVGAAWISFATQVTQLFLRQIGYLIPFWKGAAIVVVSTVCSGKQLYKQFVEG